MMHDCMTLDALQIPKPLSGSIRTVALLAVSQAELLNFMHNVDSDKA